MDTNTTSAATFGDLVKELPFGAVLSQTTKDGRTEVGLWTGKTVYESGTHYGLVFNQATGAIQRNAYDQETQWVSERGLDGNPAKADKEVSKILDVAGTQFAEKIRYMYLYAGAASELKSFRSKAEAALHDWAESNLDEDGSEWASFSETLEDIGLEGMKATYRATVQVTYEVEVEVEASSEDNARDELDNNLSYYISDVIDLGYPDDYEIRSIERN
jgi:hypothetical protein